MDWIFWLILVVVLSIIEIATVNLLTIWFVASGVVALVLSFFIDNITILSTIFVILGILLMLISRPLVSKLKGSKIEKTNLDRVIGKTGIVTEDIKKNTVGEVKVDGKKWSAISDEELLEGTVVEILKIDGVKLVVRKED